MPCNLQTHHINWRTHSWHTDNRKIQAWRDRLRRGHSDRPTVAFWLNLLYPATTSTCTPWPWLSILVTARAKWPFFLNSSSRTVHYTFWKSAFEHHTLWTMNSSSRRYIWFSTRVVYRRDGEIIKFTVVTKNSSSTKCDVQMQPWHDSLLVNKLRYNSVFQKIFFGRWNSRRLALARKSSSSSSRLCMSVCVYVCVCACVCEGGKRVDLKERDKKGCRNFKSRNAGYVRRSFLIPCEFPCVYGACLPVHMSISI